MIKSSIISIKRRFVLGTVWWIHQKEPDRPFLDAKMLRKMTLFRRKICLLHKYCIVSLSCSPSFKFVPSESHTLIIHARFKCNAKSLATPHKGSALRVLKFASPALSRMQYQPSHTAASHIQLYAPFIIDARVLRNLQRNFRIYIPFSISLGKSDHPRLPRRKSFHLSRAHSSRACVTFSRELHVCVYMCRLLRASLARIKAGAINLD